MLDFVRRNRIAITSGLLLLLSLLLLSSSSRSRQGLDPLARVALEVMRPLQVVVTTSLDALSGGWHTYVDLVGVRRENEQLRRQLAGLEEQLVRFAEAEQAQQRLAALLDFRAQIDGDAQAALIIARDPSPWSGTVTINKGESDGVRKNTAVVSAGGVVGQTIATSSRAARVLLVTDHNSGIDAVVQRSRARGIVEGALDGHCVMKYLKRGEDVEVGDRIVTSGLDGIFPKGMTIGTVTHVTRGTRGLLQVADVQPGVALDRVEEVLVVSAGAHLKDEPLMSCNGPAQQCGQGSR
jgi:rod shape-determining protein MreC